MTHFCPFKAIDTIWGTRLLRALQVKGRGDIRRQAWVVLCSGTEVNREKCGVMLKSVIIRLTSEENFSIWNVYFLSEFDTLWLRLWILDSYVFALKFKQWGDFYTFGVFENRIF